MADACTLYEESAHPHGSRGEADRDISGHRRKPGIVKSLYGGSYEVYRDGRVQFYWEKRMVAEDSQVDCSVCRLLAVAAREIGLALTLECWVHVCFRLIEEYEPAILGIVCLSAIGSDDVGLTKYMTLPNWSKEDLRRITYRLTPDKSIQVFFLNGTRRVRTRMK